MSDRRIMVLPAELVVKVDENRGDMSRAEFIDLLLDSHLGNEGENDSEEKIQQLVTRESLAEFEIGIKELLRNFLEFFITYGLEIGKPSGTGDLESLTERLKETTDRSVSAKPRKSATR